MKHIAKQNLYTFCVVLGVIVVQSGLLRAAFGDDNYIYGSIIESKEERVERLRREALFRQEQTDLTMSIFSRRQFEYEPEHIRVGSVLITPTLDAAIGYTDNVYETDGNEKSSHIVRTGAGASFKTDFPAHFIEGGASVRKGLYSQASSENYTDYATYFGGRLDVGAEWHIPLNLLYSHNHTERSSPDDASGERPTVYSIASISSGLQYIGYLLNATYENVISFIRYDDNKTKLGAFIYNGDRDRQEIKHSLTLSAMDSSRVSPFIYGEYKTIDYNDLVDDFGLNRDSHGWNVGAGAKVALSSQTAARVRYSYTKQDFHSASLNDVSGSSYGLDFQWEPSSLLGINISGARYIDETSLADASASINDAFSVRAIYELTPNLYVYPRVKYLHRDYQSTDDRKTKRLSSDVTFSYKLNKDFSSDMQFEHAVQDERRNGFAPTTAKTNTVLFTLKFEM